MHKLDHVKQHEFSQALTATRGSAPVLREKQTVRRSETLLKLSDLGSHGIISMPEFVLVTLSYTNALYS